MHHERNIKQHLQFYRASSTTTATFLQYSQSPESLLFRDLPNKFLLRFIQESFPDIVLQMAFIVRAHLQLCFEYVWRSSELHQSRNENYRSKLPDASDLSLENIGGEERAESEYILTYYQR